jgi:PAS domain S-box-containing protein
VRKDWPELASIIDKALAAIPEAKKVGILNKWMPPLDSQIPGARPTEITLTEDEQAWLDKKHTIRVTFSQSPPYFYFKEGKAVGIAVDFLNSISKYTGIEFQLANKPHLWADELKGLVGHSGPDILTAIMPTPDREKVILFTKPYINSPKFIFTRDDAPFVSSINNLFGKKVSAIKGYVTHKYLVENYPDLDLMVVDTKEEAIKAVSSGEAFAYIGDIISTPASINEFGLKNLKAACPSGLPDHSLAMGIRNDWPELRNIFDKAMGAIPAEEKAAIINKWSTIRVEYGISSGDVIKWGLIIFISVSGLVFLFVFWNKQLSRRVKERTSQLMETESRFRATFEQAAVGVAHVSLDGKFLRVNKKFCDIVGYSQDEINDMTFQDITHPDDLELDLSYLEQVLKGESKNYSMDKRYIRKDGSIVWINLTVSLLFDKKGKPQYFVSVVKDISESKQAEENLAKSEANYRGLVDNSIVGVFSTTVDGRFIFVNDAMVRMFDFETSEQMIKERAPALWRDPGNRERMLADLQKHGSVTNFEATAITHTGRHIHVLFSAKQHGDNISGMVMDITERKHAEKKILEHQERLSALSSQLTLAEEIERRRIATDLHDQVSQNLALSCMQLSAAIQSVDDVALKKQFDELNQTLISTSRDTRNLIFDLSSPTMHELGLGAAIGEWIDDKLIQRHGLDVQLVDKLKQDKLDLSLSTILFRNVRELLTNIVKHARADQVNVLLEQEDNELRITVKDNGIGFSPEQAKKNVNAEGGLGLFSIEERMTGLGGSLVIDSKAHHGTTIVMTTPLNEMKKVTT